MIKNINNYFFEFLILSISIILLTLSSLNMKISPAPVDLFQVTNNIGNIYCIPIDKLDLTNSQQNDYVKASMNHAYQLMISTFILSIVLFLISIILIIFKYYSI